MSREKGRHEMYDMTYFARILDKALQISHNQETGVLLTFTKKNIRVPVLFY